MFWADLDQNLLMKGKNMVVDVREDKSQLKIFFFLAGQVIMLHYVIDPKLW